MGLSTAQRIDIEDLLRKKIRDILQKKNRDEMDAMPFHSLLLGDQNLTTYRVIHSIVTSIGMSMYEPIAQIVAREKFDSAEIQCKAGTIISSEAQEVIQRIINDLNADRIQVDKLKEIELIRDVARKGKKLRVKKVNIDLRLKLNQSQFIFDIKTAKPNKANFIDFKRTLLEWVGSALYENPEAEINSYIAIPYNPHAPSEYKWWTIRGMLDIKHDLMVGKQFWNFLGGNNTYDKVLHCFGRVGNELQDDIEFYINELI